MLWIFFGIMALLALAALTWPLYRSEKRLSGRAILVGVLVAGGSVGLYQVTGQPTAITAAPRAAQAPGTGQPPGDVEEMVSSLANRLREEPDDINGWKMLGRSYGVLRRYPEAIDALERAVALQSGADAQTIVDLGEAVLMNDNQALLGRAGELFESAITMAPDNPKAMFYAGMAAAERGDQMLAAERWENLLNTGPPAEIEGMLKARIAQWRGEDLAISPAGSTATPASAADSSAGALTLNVSLSLADDARSVVDGGATVFIIARDPEQPSPPIAVARRQAGELPMVVTLTDSDAMIPGRLLSNFERLEILARVSSSGQPMAQSGDWFGSREIEAAGVNDVDIVIGQQVP